MAAVILAPLSVEFVGIRNGILTLRFLSGDGGQRGDVEAKFQIPMRLEIAGVPMAQGLPWRVVAAGDKDWPLPQPPPVSGVAGVTLPPVKLMTEWTPDDEPDGGLTMCEKCCGRELGNPSSQWVAIMLQRRWNAFPVRTQATWDALCREIAYSYGGRTVSEATSALVLLSDGNLDVRPLDATATAP